jgi:hypothetical protein
MTMPHFVVRKVSRTERIMYTHPSAAAAAKNDDANADCDDDAGW